MVAISLARGSSRLLIPLWGLALVTAVFAPTMPAHVDLSEADGMIGISAREVG